MSLDAFVIPPTYESKFVDVGALPQDSLMRIAEMSRARRQRAMAEEEVWAEQVKFRDEANSLLAQSINAVADEEALAREVARKSEDKAFDRLMKVFEDELDRNRGESEKLKRIHMLEKRRDKKLRQLEQELHRESFRSFWSSKAAHPVETRPANDRTTLANQTTTTLRHAYQFSAPLFATDPEEFWRRGVTIAPDLQRSMGVRANADGDGIGEELNLPAYHELALKLRAKYQHHVEEREAQLRAHQQDAQHRRSPVRDGVTDGPRYSPFSQFVQQYPFGEAPR